MTDERQVLADYPPRRDADMLDVTPREALADQLIAAWEEGYAIGREIRRVTVIIALVLVGLLAFSLGRASASEAPRSGVLVEAAADAGRVEPAPAGRVGVSLPAAAEPFPSPTGELDEGGAIGGTATWYCSSSSPCTAGYRPTDLVAAIDPTLGIPKGARVRVDHGLRTVVVTIVDVCACGGSRLIDLTSGAFIHLAPLSIGEIPVSIVELAADVTPPATDP